MVPAEPTRDRTVELVTRIQREHGLLAMAHLTGIGSGRAEIAALIARLLDAGIENLIPLRGDPPAGADSFVPPADAFASQVLPAMRTPPRSSQRDSWGRAFRWPPCCD